VIITFADGVVAETFTDASGETPIFSQLSPDPDVALDPEYEGLVYSTCDVEVSAYKFRTVIVRGVQVFANDTAILPVSMEPVDIGPIVVVPPTEPIVYEIPPNHVGTRVGMSDLPPRGTSPSVLDSVVVPEYITVHLGAPSVSASNVTVTYQNYIKNVCCSEIYSTWPENAIRANIHCQVSLSLNRIFTEWYRGRGYNFDITNSTSYDQYYVHGRNISENVGRIVDEIFDVYIRRNGFLEPFYAEYCNGTTVTCPGLKQWGTVPLAEQGYTPLGILRYFYGNDIALTEAPVIKGMPQSYPGTPLRLGSRGASVTMLQTELQRIRRNYPLIPNPGAADGVFGAATEAAVRVFQRVFDLTQDGVVGKATWYKISYIYVAVTKLAELGSEGIQSMPIEPEPTTTVRRGDTGHLVALAQFLLSVAGDFYIELQPVGVDGNFGRLTEAAVRDFQRMMGLMEDGIIGPYTWDNLYSVYFDVFNALDPISPAYPGTALRVGSRSSDVSTMQRYLNYISAYFGNIPKLTIDGIYGDATRNAVMVFQDMFGLATDGVIGANTWGRIVSVYSSLAANA
jgi:peptidoglycan hydrolase-like protein with peptidoglycan-binding domain